MDCAGHACFRQQDNLTGMHREMLDDVIDGSEHVRLATLNGAGSLEVVGRQVGKNVVCFADRRFEILQKLGRLWSVASSEFRRAIALDRFATYAADNPLADVAGKVKQKISNAVRRLVGSLPDRAFRKRSDAMAELGWVLFS